MAISAEEVAQLRASLGLPPDPFSDQVWASRTWASTGDVLPRLQEKANSLSSTTTTTTTTSDRPSGSVPDGTGSSGTTYTTGQPGNADYGDGQTVADRQDRAATARMAGALFDTYGLPDELRQVFIDAYLRDGDPTLALQAVRNDSRYDTFFPGNKREDGTLRYTEAEYLSVKDEYRQILGEVGVNANVYESQFKNLFEGDKSPDEFRAQVNALYDRVINAPAEVMQQFGAAFGIANPSASQAIGLLLNPQGVGQQVLNREINIAEVTGQAVRFGFGANRGRGEQLVNAGVTNSQAEQFYSTARTTVPVFGGIAGRANSGPFGLFELESAALLSDPMQRQRFERLQRRERSLFSRSGTAQQDQSGALTGLRRL